MITKQDRPCTACTRQRFPVIRKHYFHLTGCSEYLVRAARSCLSYSIRSVEASDATDIYSLERECFSDPYPSALLDTLMRTRRDFFFIAIENERIIGYTVGTPRGREGHIDSLAVAPHCRRKGVGEALLSAVTRALVGKGVQEISLEVRKGNRTAISFYESIRFAKSSELKHYYSDGEDAWVLRRIMESSALANH